MDPAHAPFTVVLRAADREPGSSTTDAILRPQLSTFLADTPYWRVSVRSVVVPMKHDAGTQLIDTSTQAVLNTAFLEFRLSLGGLPHTSDTRGVCDLVHFEPSAPVVCNTPLSETSATFPSLYAPVVGSQREIFHTLARPDLSLIRVRVVDETGAPAVLTSIYDTRVTGNLSDWIIVLSLEPIVSD